MNTGERIKKRREELGLTIEYVSEYTGASVECIQACEDYNNIRFPFIYEDKIFKVLKTTREYLYADKDTPTETSFNSIISKNLIYYLNISNMTQTELARRIEVRKTTVSNWVHGLKTPRMDSIDKICEVFNIKHENLLYDKKADARYSNPIIDRYYMLDGDKKEIVDNLIIHLTDENYHVSVSIENRDWKIKIE